MDAWVGGFDLRVRAKGREEPRATAAGEDVVGTRKAHRFAHFAGKDEVGAQRTLGLKEV